MRSFEDEFKIFLKKCMDRGASTTTLFNIITDMFALYAITHPDGRDAGMVEIVAAIQARAQELILLETAERIAEGVDDDKFDK